MAHAYLHFPLPFFVHFTFYSSVATKSNPYSARTRSFSAPAASINLAAVLRFGPDELITTDARAARFALDSWLRIR
jgi:hypothetical protein